MMKLSTMWKVIATLDAGGSAPLAEAALQHWDPDPGSIRFVRASANFVFAFQRAGRRHFLRLSAASERRPEALLAEAQLLVWLQDQGPSVAQPVPSRRGRLVETIAAEVGTFHAVVFAGLEGVHREVEDLAAADFRTWGAALGRLHAAMKQYRDRSLAHRESWRDHLELARRFIGSSTPALQAEWEEVSRWAASLPTGPEDYGLIHFDFETDNLCWQGDTINALDFDDSAHSWYAADIAYALRDFFAGGATMDHPAVQAFLDGYRAFHSVNPELLAQLPLFLRLHRLYTYGRLVRALDLQEGRDLPEWLQGIQAKLGSRVEAYRRSPATPL